MSVDRDDAKGRLTTVFREVFEDDGIVISDGTTAADIDGWDSVTHILLVVATEKEFGVRLSAAEVGKLQNVGKMLDLLAQRATK